MRRQADLVRDLSFSSASPSPGGQGLAPLLLLMMLRPTPGTKQQGLKPLKPLVKIDLLSGSTHAALPNFQRPACVILW